MNQLFVVNPGSTSTKLAVFDGETLIWSKTISHPAQQLQTYACISDQQDFRLDAIQEALTDAGFSLEGFKGIIGIGGLLKSVDSGVYTINEEMLSDLAQAKYGQHAANLGALIVDKLSRLYGIPGYIADPITVDEMQPIARISGHPLIPRYGRTHTLNHKRIAMSLAAELNKPYEECRLVIAHLGGGISIAAHENGRIIDSTTSRSEGAFSMDRSGQLNCWELAKLCFSGEYTKEQVLKMLNGNGGVYAYLKTKDFRDVERMKDEGNSLAADVFYGLAYQVSKEIASMAAVLCGKLDAVVLTGGIAYSEAFVSEVKKRIAFCGPVVLKPGEEEMESLAFYLNRVLAGTVTPKEYEA